MKDFPTSAKRKFTQCRQMQWLSLLGMCMRMFLVLMRLYWRRWGKRLRERGRVDDLACCQTRCLLMFRLTPEMFGFPCRRDRDYRITWDEKRMEWTCVPGQSEIVWVWVFKSDCLSLHIAYWRHIRSKILRTIFSLMGRRQNVWWRYQISWFLHLQSETCAMSNVCQGKWLLAAWFWWGWVFSSWINHAYEKILAGLNRSISLVIESCAPRRRSIPWAKILKRWNALKTRILTWWRLQLQWICGALLANNTAVAFPKKKKVLINKPKVWREEKVGDTNWADAHAWSAFMGTCMQSCWCGPDLSISHFSIVKLQ